MWGKQWDATRVGKEKSFEEMRWNEARKKQSCCVDETRQDEMKWNEMGCFMDCNNGGRVQVVAVEIPVVIAASFAWVEIKATCCICGRWLFGRLCKREKEHAWDRDRVRKRERERGIESCYNLWEVKGSSCCCYCCRFQWRRRSRCWYSSRRCCCLVNDHHWIKRI